MQQKVVTGKVLMYVLTLIAVLGSASVYAIDYLDKNARWWECIYSTWACAV